MSGIPKSADTRPRNAVVPRPSDRRDDTLRGVSGEQVAPPRREVTQTIDLDEVGAVEIVDEPLREVTQEIDVDMLEEAHEREPSQAAIKLEDEAKSAERQSTAELLRRAQGLDGVDPRFVRAAHTLESDRRSSRSKHAAEILKQRAENLEGINPRFLRAAARLEEARVSEVLTGSENPEDPEFQRREEEWRRELEKTSKGSVISFLTPPVVERNAEVKGFPKIQQQSQQRKRPPPPPASSKRGPSVPPPPPGQPTTVERPVSPPRRKR